MRHDDHPLAPPPGPSLTHTPPPGPLPHPHPFPWASPSPTPLPLDRSLTHTHTPQVRLTDITALATSRDPDCAFLPPPSDWPGPRQDFSKHFKGVTVRYAPTWGAPGALYEGELTGALVCKQGGEVWVTLRVDKAAFAALIADHDVVRLPLGRSLPHTHLPLGRSLPHPPAIPHQCISANCSPMI